MASLERQPGARQRVAAPRLGKAPQQHLGARLEEQHRGIHALRLEGGKVLRQRGCRDAARVHADRNALMPSAGQKRHHIRQQRRRQVVDAVVVAVLQDVEGDALARTRQTADQDQLHASRRSPWPASGVRETRLPNPCRAASGCNLRTAASSSTARLRPAATGITTLRTVTPRMSSASSDSGRRSTLSRAPPLAGFSRWATSFSFIFGRTAVSP